MHSSFYTPHICTKSSKVQFSGQADEISTLTRIKNESTKSKNERGKRETHRGPVPDFPARAVPDPAEPGGDPLRGVALGLLHFPAQLVHALRRSGLDASVAALGTLRGADPSIKHPPQIKKKKNHSTGWSTSDHSP